MSPKEYEAKFRINRDDKRARLKSRSLGTTDWMQTQNINYVDAGLGSGMTINTSAPLTQSSTYTLSSALSMK